MKEKQMDISEVKEAKKNISDLKIYGDGDTFKLLCKASSNEEGWMKSTKVCNVNGGCIVQVTTQQKNHDGTNAVAEALIFVPNNHIDILANPREIISCEKLKERQSDREKKIDVAIDNLECVNCGCNHFNMAAHVNGNRFCWGSDEKHPPRIQCCNCGVHIDPRDSEIVDERFMKKNYDILK